MENTGPHLRVRPARRCGGRGRYSCISAILIKTECLLLFDPAPCLSPATLPSGRYVDKSEPSPGQGGSVGWSIVLRTKRLRGFLVRAQSGLRV